LDPGLSGLVGKGFLGSFYQPKKKKKKRKEKKLILCFSLL